MKSRFNVYNQKVVFKDCFLQIDRPINLALEKIVVLFSFDKTQHIHSKCFWLGLYFILEFVTGQKPYICIAKKDNALSKIKKNNVVSLFVTFRSDIIFNFFERVIWLFIPQTNLISYKVKKIYGSYTFSVRNFFLFAELEKEFNILWNYFNQSQPSISISIVISQNHSALSYYRYLRSFQFPIFFDIKQK